MNWQLRQSMTVETVLSLDTNEVFSFLLTELGYLYPDTNIIHKEGAYLVFGGTNPVALVAHIDTLPRKAVALHRERNVLTNPGDILGADDRAGVYGIVLAAQIAARKGLPLPTLIFTDLEESGGIGVKKLIADKVLNPKGINLFVEMDRKGCNEYVYYSWSLPDAVKNYVRSFGYVSATGSYSDITDLTYEYCIPSVNVSCGYYAQHTANERLHVDELELNIDRVVAMLADPIQELHKVEDDVHSRRMGDWDCLDYFGNRHYTADDYYLSTNGGKGNKKDKKSKHKVSLVTPPTPQVYDLEFYKDDIKADLIMNGYVMQHIFDNLTFVADVELLYQLEDLYVQNEGMNPLNAEAAFEETWELILHMRDTMLADGSFEEYEEAYAACV